MGEFLSQQWIIVESKPANRVAKKKRNGSVQSKQIGSEEKSAKRIIFDRRLQYYVFQLVLVNRVICYSSKIYLKKRLPT